jgi:anti-sigma B factor antagonist
MTMATPFKVSEEARDGVLVVGIQGELVMETAPEVREPLEKAARDPDSPLIVDLTDCTFMDSIGLSTLLHGAKPLQNGESNVALVCPEGEVRRLLRLTAIDQSLPAFESFDEAVAAVKSAG